MNILIIGAGWFGCHIAKILHETNINITIVEKENKLFASMSGNNSNRLHRGFHYPRASLTRKQCILGFENFKKEYPFLCKKIKNNFIAIHKKSKVNFSEYKNIMYSEGLNFKTAKNQYNLNNIDGIFKCSEELIDFKKAKNFFMNYFISNKINLKLNTDFNKMKADLNKEYNFVVDCTACTLKKKYSKNILYEPRITLVYKSKIKNFALMLMDGPFWSIYPQNKNLYTIGSVTHSRISKAVKSFDKAKNIISKFKKSNLDKKKLDFENQILEDFNNFGKYFTYSGYYLSIATLFNSIDDERPLKIYKNKKMISVLGGKIDTVVEAGNKIKEIILQK